MALRLSNGPIAYRDTNLPSINGPYSILAWVRIVTDLNTYSHFWSLDASQPGTYTDYDHIGTLNNGTTFRAESEYNNTGQASTGTALSVGTWYHFAAVRASATSYLIYLNGVQDISITYNVTGRPSATSLVFGALGPAGASPSDIRIAAIKVFPSNALTVAQILQEIPVIVPRNIQYAVSWYPCFPGSSERFLDYSGLNNNLIESNGTITDEDPPPVSWGTVYNLGKPVSSSGTLYQQIVSGTLSSSGNIYKNSSKYLTSNFLNTSSILNKKNNKILSGVFNTSSQIQKRTTKTFLGTFTASSILQTFKIKVLNLSGSLNFSGSQNKIISKILNGSFGFSGSVNRKTLKLVNGAFNSLGNLFKRSGKSLYGTYNASGLLSSFRQKVLILSGNLSFIGFQNRNVSKNLNANYFNSFSTVYKRINKTANGFINFSGSLNRLKAYIQIIGGTINFSSVISKRITKNNNGTLNY